MRRFGKVCLKHPDLNGERYAANGGCVACSLEAARKYAANNREKVNAASKRWKQNNKNQVDRYRAAWNAANPEKARESQRLAIAKWRAANPGKRRESVRRWKRNNPTVIKTINAARRALLANSKLTPLERRRIAAIYAEARRMTVATGVTHHVDHVAPLAKGGQHHPENLRILTAGANLKKGSR